MRCLRLHDSRMTRPQVDINHIKAPEELLADTTPIEYTGEPIIYPEITDGIDLSEFYKSVEFDIMASPASKLLKNYAGSLEPFPMWRFTILIRRKFLFYTVNLIIPLISHAFITILVFYIPANSHQKMSLSINILLSLTVFFLMLAEIIPQNSLVVPLLTKYLIFTLMLDTTSVIVTAITYNVHFRSSSTHVMSDWTRKVGHVTYSFDQLRALNSKHLLSGMMCQGIELASHRARPPINWHLAGYDYERAKIQTSGRPYKIRRER